MGEAVAAHYCLEQVGSQDRPDPGAHASNPGMPQTLVRMPQTLACLRPWCAGLKPWHANHVQASNPGMPQTLVRRPQTLACQPCAGLMCVRQRDDRFSPGGTRQQDRQKTTPAKPASCPPHHKRCPVPPDPKLSLGPERGTAGNLCDQVLDCRHLCDLCDLCACVTCVTCVTRYLTAGSS